MHPILNIDSSLDLLLFMKKTDRKALFDDPIMRDMRFLKKVYPHEFKPVAHTLAGIYQFQLGPAQDPQILDIRCDDGIPLSYVLMSATCGRAYSRQIREINELDIAEPEFRQRLSQGKLSTFFSFKENAPELFNTLWPMTPAIHLPMVRRTFSCMPPDLSPPDHNNESSRQMYANLIKLTAFDALSVDEVGNTHTTARQKLHLWFHDEPELMNYAKHRIELNPSDNPSCRYGLELSNNCTYYESLMLLRLIMHYQKTAGISPFLTDEPNNPFARWAQGPVSSYGISSLLESYSSQMMNWIESLPQEEQSTQKLMLCANIEGARTVAQQDSSTLELESAYRAAINQVTRVKVDQNNDVPKSVQRSYSHPVL